MSAHNVELLSQLFTLVRATRATTPDEARAKLFMPDDSGVSPVDSFKQRVASTTRPNPEPATKDALLGAE